MISFSLFFLFASPSQVSAQACPIGILPNHKYCKTNQAQTIFQCVAGLETVVDSCDTLTICTPLGSGNAGCMPGVSETSCPDGVEDGKRYCKAGDAEKVFVCIDGRETVLRQCNPGLACLEEGDETSCAGQVRVDAQAEGDTPQDASVCNQAGGSGTDAFSKCDTCLKSGGIWTAVGCVPYNDRAETVRALVTLGLGIAGGAVVLMTLAGAFLMSTSRGNPTQVDEAKSLITSAIAGIFFLIFSVSILQFIGVRILQLPGFG